MITGSYVTLKCLFIFAPYLPISWIPSSKTFSPHLRFARLPPSIQPGRAVPLANQSQDCNITPLQVIAHVPHRSTCPNPAPDGWVLPSRLLQIPSPTVLPPREPRPALAPPISRSDAILSRPISRANWQASELLVTSIPRSPRWAHSPCPTSTANNPRSPISTWLLAAMFPAGSGRS